MPVVLDASYLIAYLSASDSHHQSAREAMLGFHGRVMLASTISLAEALVHPTRAGQSAKVFELLSRAGIQSVGIEAGDEARLASLRVESGLPLPDCCVLLVAQSQAGRIATFDASLAAAAGERDLGMDLH